MHLCEEDSVEKLQSIFEVLPHQVLELERVAIDETSSQNSLALEFFSSISVREFHWEDSNDETLFLLPKEVEKCSVRLPSSHITILFT